MKDLMAFCQNIKRRDWIVVAIYAFLFVLSIFNLITVEIKASSVVYFTATGLVFYYEASRASKAAISRQRESSTNEAKA